MLHESVGDSQPSRAAMQILLNGLIAGLGIALLAVSFQMVYLPTGIFFVALAGLFTLTPYLYLTAQASSDLWLLSVLISLAATIGLSLLFEWINHAALARKESTSAAHLISSLGTYVVLVQIVEMVWGNGTQTLRAAVQSTIQIDGIVLTTPQLTMAAVALALLSGFLLLLFTTNIGIQLRALADSVSWFVLFGHNVVRYRLLCFALAGLFVGAAALVTAFDNGFDPFGGLHALLLALVASIIGGRTSFVRPIVGAIVLGIIRAETLWFLSARWQDAISFMLLAVFFLLRPEDFFQQKARLEAAGK